MKESPYKLTVKLNSKVHEIETYDIKEAMLGLKPRFVKTKMNVTVEKDGKKFEKHFFVQYVKRMFINPVAMDIFIKRIILK